MKRFFKVEMAADGWGLLVNEGTAEEPKFRVVLKGSEPWMQRMAHEMNNGSAQAKKLLEFKRHD